MKFVIRTSWMMPSFGSTDSDTTSELLVVNEDSVVPLRSVRLFLTHDCDSELSSSSNGYDRFILFCNGTYTET